MQKLLRTIKRFIPAWVFLSYHWLRGVLAVLIYRYPARDLYVIGVTGTDGKTTTVHLIFAVLRAAGLPVSLISTTGAIIHGRENAPLGLHVTTPNPFELQKFLRQAREAGSKYIVLETTSHGLAQHRVIGCNFRVGVVTNITHEHLDYHKTWKRYFQAKAKLLRRVETSILNRDDPAYARTRGRAHGQVVSYGLSPEADLTAVDVVLDVDGTVFTIPSLDVTVNTRFLGAYNVQNMLAAAAVGLQLGVSPAHIVQALEEAVPPPGRLEPVEADKPFTVFVDFAHTSNSLENMLKMLREVTQKHLIVVFGCAGERDVEKRRPMGASAGRYCDFTVLTAEDPRTENLEDILDQIAAGCEAEGAVLQQSYFRIPDRTEAIRFAIQELARPGDVVVTTGKAHEQSMCFGTTEYPWDEFVAVRAALEIGDRRS